MLPKVQHIYDKGSGKINEDDFLITEEKGLYAVFDGATSLVPYVSAGGKTGGRIATDIAKDVFSSGSRRLYDLALAANRKIGQAMEAAGINTSEKEALWSVSAAAVAVDEKSVEHFGIGDCLVLAVLKGGGYELLTPHHDHDLETMKLWKANAVRCATRDDIYGSVKDKLVEVRRGANINYGTLNGDPEAKKFFRHGTYPLKNLESLILFTDGLFIPKEDPESPEDWDLFADIYRESGLEGVLKYVRAIEDSDPECLRYPRFKQHDDIAAVELDFG